MNSLAQSINSESVTQLGRGLAVSPKFAKLIAGTLILVIFYMLAIFGWSLWDFFQPRQTININALASNNKSKQQTKLNINQLTALNLFGDSKVVKQTQSSQLDAPVTRLKLKLRGVYSASDEQLAGAMIEAQNKQEVYRVGSKLPGAAGLKLHKIMADRVIMSRGGKYETLLIEDFGKSTSSNVRSSNRRNTRSSNATKPRSSSTKSTIDKRNDMNLASEIGKLRSKLSDPQSLGELVAVAPAMNGDEFQGFRLTPGKNRALFSRLGLRRNDVVTMVNGISLDDPSSAFSLMEQIKTADEINLTVKRGGKEMNILFGAQ